MDLTSPSPETSYVGPPIDDRDILVRLPSDLRALLEDRNGFIVFDGGLHVRGACRNPDWHSLRTAWQGDLAFHELYKSVKPEDIPFAQDCLGDQFLLRDENVLRLSAETGDVELVTETFQAFLNAANADPIEFLLLHPLLQHRENDGPLEPGHLIHVYPPFCFAESSNGVSLRATPAMDVIAFHAALAANLPGDGETVQIQVEDP